MDSASKRKATAAPGDGDQRAAKRQKGHVSSCACAGGWLTGSVCDAVQRVQADEACRWQTRPGPPRDRRLGRASSSSTSRCGALTTPEAAAAPSTIASTARHRENTSLHAPFARNIRPATIDMIANTLLPPFRAAKVSPPPRPPRRRSKWA
jgi:hypothetical protein